MEEAGIEESVEGHEETLSDINLEEGVYSSEYEGESAQKFSDEKYAIDKLYSRELAEYLENKGVIPAKEIAKNKRSPHGVVAFFHYTDHNTGKTYYLVEQNKENHLIEKDRGGIRLIGGARDFIDGRLEGSFEALVRELWEEFKSPTASRTSVEALYENGEKYITIEEAVNRKLAYTDVYIIEIKQKSKWNIVATSGSTGDTGIFRVFDDETILNLPDQYFAYGSASLIKGFVLENLIMRANYFTSIGSYLNRK